MTVLTFLGGVVVGLFAAVMIACALVKLAVRRIVG